MNYDCPSCAKSYATKYSRNRHIQLMHDGMADDLQSTQDSGGDNTSDSQDSHADSTTTDMEEEAEAKSQELDVSSNDEDDPIVGLANEAESQKHFRELVAQRIFSYKELKTSSVYKELKGTVDKYMDNGYDLDEAVLSTVRKRKYLLNRIYDDQHDHSEEDGSGEEGPDA